MSTVTINGNVWTTQTIPAIPVAPASMEFQHNSLVAANTNPFTGKQQVYSWGVQYYEVSVSYATMTNSTAQTWSAFIESLNGPMCVFAFPVGNTNLYPKELTIDNVQSSTNPRYFRLKTNSVKWAVDPGGVYRGFTFECREVL